MGMGAGVVYFYVTLGWVILCGHLPVSLPSGLRLIGCAGRGGPLIRSIRVDAVCRRLVICHAVATRQLLPCCDQTTSAVLRTSSFCLAATRQLLPCCDQTTSAMRLLPDNFCPAATRQLPCCDQTTSALLRPDSFCLAATRQLLPCCDQTASALLRPDFFCLATIRLHPCFLDGGWYANWWERLPGADSRLLSWAWRS